jgi:RHS repeat-associated protein
LVAEYDGSGNLLRRYVHGPGVDEPLLWYEGSTLASRRHLRADHQGSVVAVSDVSGNSLGIDSYSEYGIKGASNIGRFQYTGQIYLAEVGLNYYKARMYSARWGRFLQVDPVGYKDDINLYTYVGNDPLDKTDPSGTYAVVDDATAFIVGGIVGVGLLEMRGGTHSLGERTGAFMSGGVVGVGVIYAPVTGGASVVAAGAVIGGTAAAVNNLTQQTIDVTTGEQKAFDDRQAITDVAVGTLAGGALAAVPGVKVPGLSSGRGNASAVARAARTRIANGNAQTMSTATAIKGAVGSQTHESGRSLVQNGIDRLKNWLCDRTSVSPRC